MGEQQNKDLSHDAQRVGIVIDRALHELRQVDEAWKTFQRSTSYLAVMQPELLGQSINQLTNTMDRLYALLSGQSICKGAQLIGQNGVTQPQTEAQRVSSQKRRAEIVEKLMDVYVDNMS